MTTIEKIANAKKRIEELERLIQHWNKSNKGTRNVINCPLEVDQK